MRLPKEIHTDRPRRIHETVHDFELEDVWALPTPGGPDDFDRLLAGFGSTGAPDEDESPLVRFIWAVRRKLGEWFGWVPDGCGGYRGQMAVLVKPNGLFGRAYLVFFKPFRYLIIYPAMLRKMDRTWRHEMSA